MKITELEKNTVKKILADWQSIRGTQLQTDVKYLATELLKAWEHIETTQAREQVMALSADH